MYIINSMRSIPWLFNFFFLLLLHQPKDSLFAHTLPALAFDFILSRKMMMMGDVMMLIKCCEIVKEWNIIPQLCCCCLSPCHECNHLHLVFCHFEFPSSFKAVSPGGMYAIRMEHKFAESITHPNAMQLIDVCLFVAKRFCFCAKSLWRVIRCNLGTPRDMNFFLLQFFIKAFENPIVNVSRTILWQWMFSLTYICVGI